MVTFPLAVGSGGVAVSFRWILLLLLFIFVILLFLFLLAGVGGFEVFVPALQLAIDELPPGKNILLTERITNSRAVEIDFYRAINF